MQKAFSRVMQQGGPGVMLIEVLKPLQSRESVGSWVDALAVLANMAPLAEVRARLSHCCRSMADCQVACGLSA